MRTGIIKIASALCLWGIVCIFQTSCTAQRPIRVGFVADLTGPNAALGVDGRDGALLAMDRINSEGGVSGRPLELIVRDDLGTSNGALKADGDLIDNEHVFAIIGHMTSGTMMAAWPKYKDSGVIFLSPTVSTPQLSGMDDNFFRLIPVNSMVAEKLALYASRELGLKRVAILYDTDNAAFTDTYREGFAKNFTEAGGEIVMSYDFSSASAPDFKPVLQDLKLRQPDGIFILASAFDTALIAQQSHLVGLDARLMASNWSLTDDLIENGGTAVEGMIAVVTHDENNQSPKYLDFVNRFQERFSRHPTFAAAYGYEAVLVLANALEKTDGEMSGLASALLETQNFAGVNGTISFDPNGDVTRTMYLIMVRDGKFITAQIFDKP
jgi:branched-chain amino acid transport system substrate-binding protein